FGHGFCLVARPRTILDLRPAVSQHRIETIAVVAPEPCQIENRMSIAVAGVTGTARVRHEDGAETVGQPEDAVGLVVTPEARGPLRARTPLYRSIGQISVGWGGGEQFASGGGCGDQRCEEGEFLEAHG